MPTPSPAKLESTLTRAWLTRGPLACALWPVSLLFGALSAVRRGLYRAGVLTSTRLPVPVVVVGNIFIGGTGKTPLTIWLAGELTARGWRPGIVSRGYGGDQAAPRPVTATALPRAWPTERPIELIALATPVSSSWTACTTSDGSAA